MLLWGVNWPMMKMALAELNFWVFRSYCIASRPALVCCFQPEARRPRSRCCCASTGGACLVCALCNVAAWNILSAAALTMLPSGRAGWPTPCRSWVVLLSQVFLGEVLTFANRRDQHRHGRHRALAGGRVPGAAAPVAALMMMVASACSGVGIVLFKGFRISSRPPP